MFEQIISELVRKETYYIKKKNGDIYGDLLFDSYNQLKTALWFLEPNAPFAYLFQLNEIIIYKYVSKEEFYKKLKEKYDDKCLNIILKQLVNETFEW